METWDKIDNKILNLLQENFPLSPTPFQDIAIQLEITEEEVMNRIAGLRQEGVIRRIGGIMNTRTLGFYSTLCACQVPEEKLLKAGGIINSYRQVTHNYIRDHQQYNIWFTLTASSRDEVTKLIRELESKIDTVIVNMPARKIYKIKVSFEMES